MMTAISHSSSSSNNSNNSNNSSSSSSNNSNNNSNNNNEDISHGKTTQQLQSGGHIVTLCNVPPIALEEPCILGIDEAGRGPVLGPLVYSVFLCPASKATALLKELGAADSKSMTPEQRSRFVAAVKAKYTDTLGWNLAIVSAERISNCMLQRNKYNLNSLSYDTVYSLLGELFYQHKIKVEHVYVDTLGKPEKYQQNLKEKFPHASFTVSTKADDRFPIVGAASIFAKVTRDHELENWHEEKYAVSRKFGSGYPGDPDTVAWLKAHMDKVFGFPTGLVRFSWSSCTRILDADAVPVEWAEDEEEKKPSQTSAKRSAPDTVKHHPQTGPSFGLRSLHRVGNIFDSSIKW